MNILRMLDKDKYAEEQIAQNYQILAEQWGEMTITNVGGFQIKYIDINKAFFNGASITYLVLTIIMFTMAIILGKIVLQQLAKMYTSANTQMADLAAIQTQEMIKEKKDKKEWF